MTLTDWTNLAIILLAVEAFVFVLIPAVLLYYSVRGMQSTRAWLRTIGLPQSQRISRLVAERTNTYSAKVTEPFVQVEASTTQARATLSAFPNLIRRRRTRRTHV